MIILRTCLLAIATILLTANAGKTTIIHVPGDSSTIQAGINGAINGDTVLVADGTYTGNGNRDIDFTGKAIVVMSENGPETTIIDCEGSSEDNHRGFYFHNGEGPGSVLQGFTITNGWNNQGGGGIRCESSSPTLINNIIEKNIVITVGGGIYNRDSNPTITNCTFYRNHAAQGWPPPDGYGAGMFNYHSNPTVTNCLFKRNSSLISGGGMYNSECNPIITNCNFIGNSASSGTGITNASYSYSQITNCIFLGDSTASEGPGIVNHQFSHTTITNCTFSRNDGGMRNYNSSPTIKNCIFWGNTSFEIQNEISSDPTVTYSDVRGGWEGEGNIDVNPSFRDPVSDDFHLMAITCGDSLDSPCIDTGHPDVVDAILDCEYGLGTELCDMGAYGGRGDPTVSIKQRNESASATLPRTFCLSQNYPNPFNPSTTIAFDLVGTPGAKQPVRLTIYDIRGRRVRNLVDSDLEPGTHKIHWDGRDDQGEPVASGIYLYTLKNGDNMYTRKMVLLK